jgi:hypothetical protein
LKNSDNEQIEKVAGKLREKPAPKAQLPSGQPFGLTGRETMLFIK